MSEFANAAPVFWVNNVTTTAQHYRDVIGFQYDRLHGDPPSFAILRRGEAEIMMFCSWDSWIRIKFIRRLLKRVGVVPRPNGRGNWDAYLRVSDMSALHDEMQSKGARIIRAPNERGGRLEMEVLDPDGRLLCFGQTTRDTR